MEVRLPLGSIPCVRPRRELRSPEDVAGVLLGDHDLDVHDRLEKRRLALLHRFLVGERARDLERHLRRVHGMVLPVVDRRLEVHHGESREEPFDARLLDPFLDRGDEVLRNGSSEDLVRELELRATRKGLEADPAVRELTVASGLLLVAAVGLERSVDGLAIRDLRRMERHFDAEFLLQPRDRDLDMELPRARTGEARIRDGTSAWDLLPRVSASPG